jgi:hypothetical protein
VNAEVNAEEEVKGEGKVGGGERTVKGESESEWECFADSKEGESEGDKK